MNKRGWIYELATLIGMLWLAWFLCFVIAEAAK